MSVLQRVVRLFVVCDEQPARKDEPRISDDRHAAGDRAGTPMSVAVLCAATDAFAMGAALGLVAAGERRAGCALVCVWRAADEGRVAWRAPALPAAGRLARSLQRRELPARATGRLVVSVLAADAEVAASQSRRLAAACPLPTVLVMAGPRDLAFEELLAEQDVVVVGRRPGAGPELERLALLGLAGGEGRTCACELPSTPHVRALATAGVGLAPSMRRALSSPTGELA